MASSGKPWRHGHGRRKRFLAAAALAAGSCQVVGFIYHNAAAPGTGYRLPGSPSTSRTELSRRLAKRGSERDWDDSFRGWPFDTFIRSPAAQPSTEGTWQTSLVVLFSSLAAAALLAAIGVGVVVYNAPKGSTQEVLYENWYVRAARQFKKNLADKPAVSPKPVPMTVAKRIRTIGSLLDLAQRDIYNEVWASLEIDAEVLKAYLPLCEYYIDAAFPQDGADLQGGELRKAMVFELSRFTREIADFKQAAANRRIREVEKAFAELSVSYDRYLKAAQLYEGYDPIASTEVFYEGIEDNQLVYTPLVLQKPAIRDEVLVIRGPDKGKVGRVIWKYGTQSAVVKLEPNPLLGGSDVKAVREVKAYPYQWIALTRSAQQNLLLDLILGAMAAAVSISVTYPIESIKSRLQAGMAAIPEGGPLDLMRGLPVTLVRELPPKGMYIAGFNGLTRQFCMLPFVDANNPDLKLLVMIPAGAIAYMSGTIIRAPGELISRQMQAGLFQSEGEAIGAFLATPVEDQWQALTKAWILVVVRGIPFGALQCTLYDFLRDRLELVQFGISPAAQPLIWGALAGAMTGILTNPPDLILSRTMSNDKARQAAAAPPVPAGGAEAEAAALPVPAPEAVEVTAVQGEHLSAAQPLQPEPLPAVASVSQAEASTSQAVEVVQLQPANRPPAPDIWGQLREATMQVNDEDGPLGFFRGCGVRALQIGSESCVWFTMFEALKSAVNLFVDF